MNCFSASFWWLLYPSISRLYLIISHDIPIASLLYPHTFPYVYWIILDRYESRSKSPCFWVPFYILVGGLEHEFHFSIYREESSQLTFIFFRGVETTNQLSFWKKIEESVWYTYVNYHLPTIKSSVNHHWTMFDGLYKSFQGYPHLTELVEDRRSGTLCHGHRWCGLDVCRLFLPGVYLTKISI
jgi:hypothetical protein